MNITRNVTTALQKQSLVKFFIHVLRQFDTYKIGWFGTGQAMVFTRSSLVILLPLNLIGANVSKGASSSLSGRKVLEVYLAG